MHKKYGMKTTDVNDTETHISEMYSNLPDFMQCLCPNNNDGSFQFIMASRLQEIYRKKSSAYKT